MQFSSPLKKNSTKVMLLGSGELGKEVIISLQRLGMEVIAVDRYENAPGHQVAHRAYTIDMTDAEALEQLIQNEKPALVVPEIEAINTKLLEKLEAENITTVIPNVRAVQLTTSHPLLNPLPLTDHDHSLKPSNPPVSHGRLGLGRSRPAHAGAKRQPPTVRGGLWFRPLR